MKRRAKTEQCESNVADDIQAQAPSSIGSSYIEDEQIGNGIYRDVTNSESILSKALMNLSFNDRNAIEEEIHGVSCVLPQETDRVLTESLASFDRELARIEHKPGYLKAQALLMANSATHTHFWMDRREFRLRFLRSELFRPREAAVRFAGCMDFLLDIYGEYALRRPIRLTDMSREEMMVLREGTYQLLPYRDRSGRRIYAIVVNSRKDVSRRVLLKVLFYLWFVLSGGSDIANNDINNIETQRKGAIAVIFPSFAHKQYNNNSNVMRNIKFLKQRSEINAVVGGVIPIRITAIHICLPRSSRFQIVSSFVLQLKQYSTRIRIHLGDPLEIRYKLQGYGIPAEFIPATDAGNIKIVNLRKWVKLRKHVEKEEQEWMVQAGTLYSSSNSEEESSLASTGVDIHMPMSNIVECPLSADVVFRRGRSLNFHPGNVMFENLIELRIHEHTIDPGTTQSRRRALEMTLIEKVRSNGGRFLKWEADKCWWVNMDSIETTTKGNNNSNNSQREALDKEILSKVHYAFRDFRKKMLRTKQELIVNASSTHVFEQQQDGQKRARFLHNNTKKAAAIVQKWRWTIVHKVGVCFDLILFISFTKMALVTAIVRRR
uniref:DUF6824 domain-containing protein n=1 Tax=Pseudo-nitzschia australis TaxID=44445 RepID=A0A7S4ENX2_9STRA